MRRRDYTRSSRCGQYIKLARVATPSGNTDYTHDTARRVSTRTYANNIKTSYTYDTTGRVSQMKLEDVTDAENPVLLDRYDYTYTGLNQEYVRTETTGAVVETLKKPLSGGSACGSVVGPL